MQTAENAVLPRDLILATARDLGLTMTTQFVPWSQSRNKGEKDPSLNWVVTLHRTTPGDGHGRPPFTRAVLTTDYGAGCGHCPSYKASVKALGGINSVMRHEHILFECENGKNARHMESFRTLIAGKAIEPDFCDVLSSLVMDAMVLDHNDYEDWADNCGYDKDSRKGEAIYRACLDIALKLRNGIGDKGMEALRAACQDY